MRRLFAICALGASACQSVQSLSTLEAPDGVAVSTEGALSPSAGRAERVPERERAGGSPELNAMGVGPRRLDNAAPRAPIEGAFVASEHVQAEPPFKRVLCFGDSLTAGVTLRLPIGQALLTPAEGYVPKLTALLTTEYGAGMEVIESGRPGETTTAGVQRLSNETRSLRPDLVLILEGVGDVNNDDPEFGEARRNLTEMIRIVRGRDGRVIIGTVPPLNPEGFRAGPFENVMRLNEIIRGIAAREEVPVADHERAFGQDLSLQGPDGLHPNDNGYRVMAETWFRAIVALAKSTPP